MCWPYVLLPYGFGQIFHQIIQSGFQKAHHPIEFNMIWKGMLIPSLGYIVGLILGMFYYRKPREYKTETYVEDENTINEIKPYVLVVTIVAILATFLVQTFTDSMIFGALAVYSYSLFRVFTNGENWIVNLLKVLKSCHL